MWQVHAFTHRWSGTVDELIAFLRDQVFRQEWDETVMGWQFKVVENGKATYLLVHAQDETTGLVAKLEAAGVQSVRVGITGITI
jgi:hypothetical protein